MMACSRWMETTAACGHWGGRGRFAGGRRRQVRPLQHLGKAHFGDDDEPGLDLSQGHGLLEHFDGGIHIAAHFG